ncbi:C-terminal binding protein [Kaistia dalseonensis]|uniref:Phosphoglycerate dehydrogenase-like enzyme n=1 Tax=Kaistia dalseonensis TaxID=410840 RepID=A0ABU0HAA0_9HYPH|nr:C-terminal binding protein [Kaistia dalseonensis]MCX5496609.1 C-terminal binding protein [Kaistia dalseonensis]MDQ0439232.1 phosphoglycerate dehydrogenase-like enzyme [Kaistia dalseonensis]
MSSRLRLFTPDAQYPDDGTIERQTAGPDVDWTICRERAPESLPDAALAEADGIVVWHEMKINADFLARIPKCRIIARAGVGFDHIDLEATGRAGIPVCNTPDYGTSEVADHAIALMLALTRGIVSYHEHLVQDPIQGFNSALAPLVRRSRGRTFGVVGFGRIGTATALRAKAFGFRVVGYDPYVSPGTEIALGIERVQTLEALLATSDIVSLHCPLTTETRGMIGKAALQRMKSNAILINTARGAIVDVPALIAAIRDGEIAGAGIDVLPVEPPRADDAIALAYRDLKAAGVADRLLLTPHAAWSSPESAADARRLAVETVMLYLQDGKLRNLVNGDYLAATRR